jgi:hypothetical protein
VGVLGEVLTKRVFRGFDPVQEVEADSMDVLHQYGEKDCVVDLGIHDV